MRENHCWPRAPAPWRRRGATEQATATVRANFSSGCSEVWLQACILETLCAHELRGACERCGVVRRLRGTQQDQQILGLALHLPVLACGGERRGGFVHHIQ